MATNIDLGLGYLTDLRQIGRGGFGYVYAATDTRFDRRVAIKVLGELETERDRQRFERECRIMGRLSSHPDVVTVYDAGYAPDGSAYLIMELIEGGTLADRLRAMGRVPWPQAVAYTIPIARALGHGHAQGVLHRDVKPENILMQGEHPKLTDFGIAAIRDSTGATSTKVSASWLHTAPETFQNKRDERSDIYSLTSTLQTLIVGQAPFWDDTDESVYPLMLRLLNDVPPPLPLELGPPALSEALQRGLAKEPDQRPQTTDELIALLEAVGEQTTRVGPPPASLRPAAPPAPPPAAPPDPAVPAPAPPVGVPAQAAPFGTAPATAVQATEMLRTDQGFPMSEQFTVAAPEITPRVAFGSPGQPVAPAGPGHVPGGPGYGPGHGPGQAAGPGGGGAPTPAPAGGHRGVLLAAVGLAAAVVVIVGLILATRHGSTTDTADPGTSSTTGSTAGGGSTTPSTGGPTTSATTATTTAPTVPPSSATTTPTTPAAPQITITDLTGRGQATASTASRDAIDACRNTTTFGAANVLDGNRETAWRTAGSGVGQTIQVSFNRAFTITSVGLVPGYAKVDPCDGTDRFQQNRRIQQVVWHIGDQQIRQTLKPNQAELQTITLSQPVRADTVTLEIVDTTAPGSRDFTAISDLQIQGG